MKLAHTWVMVLAIFTSGCITIHESIAPKPMSGSLSAAISPDMPKSDYLPEQSATVPGTRYVFVQAAGGNFFLGPIYGTINIANVTKQMAEQYKQSLLSIDPAINAGDAMAKLNLKGVLNNSAYTVRPFVFVQHCYDDVFRLAFVLHVESTDPAQAWVGRYVYHLPTVYPVSRFASLSEQELEQYKAELHKGAAITADLMKRDLTGDLSASGKRVKFGTLHIMGNKLGGLGIYTMPEEMHFPNAQVIEEMPANVVVRLRGNMHATGVFGGLAFGVHYIDKKLVHTLQAMPDKQ